VTLTRWTWPLILTLALPLAARADAFRGARLRFVDPGVSFQRGAETTAEEAVPNAPFLPGDRLWTDPSGRVELQFDDGTIVRVDNRSKLDFVARDEGRRDAILRLWSGGLYVHGRDPRLSIETAAGVVQIERGGVYRVDVDSGEARLSVYEGEAMLESASVRAGERAYVRRGEPVDGPEGFDRASGDDFAQWDQERSERDAWADARPEYVPEEIAPYAGELEGNGTWYYQTDVGYVWRPYVSPGWRPYTNGRWVWTAYGWTWVPFERWGWAPSHYGRWGFSGALGWYWIPSAGWGPAWVSWAVGPSYVGWCPLGFHNQPASVYDRGGAVARTAQVSNPWVFVRREDLGARRAQRRFEGGPEVTRGVRVLDPAQGRLTRDGQIGEGGDRAVPRSTVRTRPGPAPADTVPEPRPAPATLVPAPMNNPHYELPREREAERRRPSPRDNDRATPPGPRPQPSASAAPAAPAERAERSHPTDVRSSPAGAVAIGQPRNRTDSPASESPDREVMRPLFRPLGRPEGQHDSPPSSPSRGDAGNRRPEDSRPQPQAGSRATPHADPPQARPATPAPTSHEGAVRRKKEDN